MGGVIKRQLTHDKQLDLDKYGHVVDMATFTAGGQNVVCLATSTGKLCGLDLRTNMLAWDLTNNSKFGTCTFYYYNGRIDFCQYLSDT